MVEKFKLGLATREPIKPNALRRGGKIPGTLYGPGEASMSVEVDGREFGKLPAAAYSHIVELSLPKGSVPALIRNVQRDYRNGQVLNIEFYRVAKDRKLTVTVPLKFIGASSAVTLGGIFVENYDEVHVECFPDDIPDFLEVDISQIVDLDTGIHFSQLTVPKGVTITNPPEEVMCRVVTPKKEEAAPAAAAPTAEAAPAAAAAGADKDKDKEKEKDKK
jgi:large subunit ribosomal protein L25